MQALWNGINSFLRVGVSAMTKTILQKPIVGAVKLSTLSSVSVVTARPVLCSTPSSSPFLIPVRTILRDYWPRPSETMRIRKHGWKKRMSTANGRRIIMKRILKGRYILSH